MNTHAPQSARDKDGWIARMVIGFAAWVCVPAAALMMAQAPPATPALATDAWKTKPAATTGLNVGDKIPAFELHDQNGKLQSFQSVRGPKGAAIYFMRSADW